MTQNTKKNIYETALKWECSHYDGIEAVCKAIGEDFVTESNAWIAAVERPTTDKERKEILRKIGYEI